MAGVLRSVMQSEPLEASGVETYRVTEVPRPGEYRALGIASASSMEAKGVRAACTGEKRQPKAGEWYISGAIPEAYKAPHDLLCEYNIAKLVRVREVRHFEIVDKYV